MTYEKIKQAYPLGCSVKLKNRIGSRKDDPFSPRTVIVTGKILAILDPKKHGPKCLLFKIENPEGRGISNESAEATIRRKGIEMQKNPAFQNRMTVKKCPLWSADIDFKGLALPWDEHGTLKWLRPSDIKERVGNEEPVKMPNMATDEEGNMYHWASQLHKSKPMDRTEELKRILKPGMRVKLKETTEGNWPKDSKYDPYFAEEMKEHLGKWVDVEDVEDLGKLCFRDETLWEWPFSMIEKVKGEEEDEPTSDTIPVPREKLKEELKYGYKPPVAAEIRRMFERLHGQSLVNSLLQEIEEEEKYIVKFKKEE